MNFSWAAAARRIPARAPIPAHQRDSERSRPGGVSRRNPFRRWKREDLGSNSDFRLENHQETGGFEDKAGSQLAVAKLQELGTPVPGLHPQLLPHKGLGKWALTRPVQRWSKTVLLWLSLWWFLIVIVIMDDYGTWLLWCSFWLLLCLLFSARGLTVRGACWHSLPQKAGWFWPEKGRYELRCPSKSIKI